MKTQIRKPENSPVIQNKSKAANQAALSKVLQAYKDRTVQRESLPDEDELLQGKFETTQLMDLDEDEELPVQGKFETAQRDAIDDEELLQGKFTPVQKKETPNRTGLPDDLKAGIENRSGFSMDAVRVHYNSPQPAQLQALAYTQGTDIHVGPGQEKHLPHEAWHVVQQMQGRVQPTTQLQGVNINDNEGLEKEADVMGNQTNKDIESNILQAKTNYNFKTIQRTYRKEIPEGSGTWRTVSSFNKEIRLQNDRGEGEGGALTVFCVGNHRIVTLEWHDGITNSENNLTAHLETPSLQGKYWYKPFNQASSILPGRNMKSNVALLQWDLERAKDNVHKTTFVNEERKEQVRTLINQEVGTGYNYNVLGGISENTYNCYTWAKKIAPESII